MKHLKSVLLFTMTLSLFNCSTMNQAQETPTVSESRVPSNSDLKYQWSVGPNMPAAVGEVAAAVINDKMYVVGNGIPILTHAYSTMVYDFASQSWSRGVKRPFTGNHHAAEVVDNKLYLFGGIQRLPGENAAGKVQIFDPVQQTWTQGKDMPYAAGSIATAAIGRMIYVAGGAVKGKSVKKALKYDTETGEWSPIADMPTPCNHAAAGTDGRRLYVFGGRPVTAMHSSPQMQTVQIYDPETDTWITSDDPASGIKPLPTARGGMGKAVFLNGEFYILGGEGKKSELTTSKGTFAQIEIYNPSTNTWRSGPPMAVPKHGVFPVEYKGNIYLAGGSDGAGNTLPGCTMEILNISQ